jgi:protein O-mannosyl-transferase
MEPASSRRQNHPKSMAAPKSPEPPAGCNGHGAVFVVCALLILAVLLVFGQTLRYEFVNYDDNEYVYENPQVIKGLTWYGIGWAFTHSQVCQWVPLTTISHLIDCSVYGLNAGGHHLTNVLLHAASAVLLFLVLRRATGALWSSAFVAAVFALHPLRVESVAWVSERKDVLSGLFFMLTLWTYVRYVQNGSKAGIAVPAVASRPWTLDYCWVLLFFTLGLMSKPMLVTLPFVLLLLDYWPLGRFQPTTPRSTFLALCVLFREKFPLFLLAAGSSVITFLVQKSSRISIDSLPMSKRLLNVTLSYGTYVAEMVWPDNLAGFYPYPPTMPMGQIMSTGALLLAITVLAILLARRFAFFLVGWLWYLGMLVPVIGLVQTGSQSHADRHTYLPQIGLYLVIVWAVRNLTVSWRYRRLGLGGAALSVIAALMICAGKQTACWHDSETLWKHTLARTSSNNVAWNNLGYFLFQRGQMDEAITCFKKALKINPNFFEAYNNLGVVRLQMKQPEEAMVCFQKALEISPDFVEAHYNLGCAFDDQGRLDEAIMQYKKAIELKFDLAEAHNNWGGILDRQSQWEKATEQYRIAIEIKPDYVDAHGNLANALFKQGWFDEAIKEFQRTLELMPSSVKNHYMLGLALQNQKKFGAAIIQFQEVLKLEPGHVLAQNGLAWLLATCPEASLRNGSQAVELARNAEQLSKGMSPQILDTLAAAYAEAGRYPEAVETARRALSLITTQNNNPRADALQIRLKLYEANSPFHEKP